MCTKEELPNWNKKKKKNNTETPGIKYGSR